MDRKFFTFALNSRWGAFLNISYDDYPPPCGNIYGSFKFQDIIVRKKSLFREEISIPLPYTMYMYEEDGVFYEFFSGKMVGKRRTPETTSLYIKPDDDIVRNNYILTSFRDFWSRDYTVHELSAVQFSSEVKHFIPYKEHMASEMSRLLDAIDAEYQRRVDVVNAKKNAAIQAEQNSQSWLDSIIDGP